MKRIGNSGLLIAIVVLATAMLVPNTSLTWVRAHNRWISYGMGRVEVLWPGVDTVHMMAMASLGIIARLALPKIHAGWIILGVLLFSIVTELLQFYVPGRTSLVSDVRDNMIGLLVGLGFISLILWLYHHLTQRFG